MSSDEAQPTNAELMQAILALHSFTDAGLQRLDAKIGGVEARLLDQMNRRFDRVDLRFDALEGRVRD